ncbi:DUF6350 family protein [Longispora albida]|uniref:cell division protein PerM n=1 Tax=Longispora albida TaxID=203523 RepID=UPI000369BFB9|nr:DUF6350 family protein [Longispora albida]
MEEETYTATQRETVLIRPAPPKVKKAPKVSVFSAALVTSGWAALISFAPVLVLAAAAWLFEGRSAASASAIGRFSAAAWLLGHGVPISAGDVRVSLAPLALTILIVYRLVRAGAHTARGVGLGRSIADAPADPRQVVKLLAPVIGAVAGAYGLLGGLAAVLASTPGLTISPIRALLTTGLLAAASAGAGALAESGLFGGVWRRVPRQSRHALRTAVVGVLALAGAGAGAVGVSVAVNGGAVGGVLRSYDTGVLGQAGLTLVCLVYAPSLSVWAASYLVGPGFLLGAGTSVSLLDVRLGAIPAAPVFGALPDRPVTWLGALVMLVPLLATALAGALLARRSDLRTPRLAKSAMLAGLPAGVLCALAALFTSGSLGTEEMADLGAVWWQFGLFGGLAVAVGAPLGAVAYRLGPRLFRR